MFLLFSNPKSNKDKLLYANGAIIQGIIGLTAVGIGFLLLSPSLGPEVGAGVATILLILIAISVISLIRLGEGALNKLQALEMKA